MVYYFKPKLLKVIRVFLGTYILVLMAYKMHSYELSEYFNALQQELIVAKIDTFMYVRW